MSSCISAQIWPLYGDFVWSQTILGICNGRNYRKWDEFKWLHCTCLIKSGHLKLDLMPHCKWGSDFGQLNNSSVYMLHCKCMITFGQLINSSFCWTYRSFNEIDFNAHWQSKLLQGSTGSRLRQWWALARTSRSLASDWHLDLRHVRCVLYGVKYIDLVSFDVPVDVQARVAARCVTCIPTTPDQEATTGA